MEPNEEVKKDEGKKMRQIIIETDGDNIKLAKTDVAGKIELVAVLQLLLDYLKNSK